MEILVFSQIDLDGLWISQPDQKRNDQLLLSHVGEAGVGVLPLTFPFIPLEMLFLWEKGLHFMKFATRLHPYL